MFKFKLDDFMAHTGEDKDLKLSKEDAVEFANMKLQEWLDESSTVYGMETTPAYYRAFGLWKSAGDTHVGKLVLVQKIDDIKIRPKELTDEQLATINAALMESYIGTMV